MAQNAHYFAWGGCGLQGTPGGNFGKTEAVEVNFKFAQVIPILFNVALLPTFLLPEIARFDGSLTFC